MIYLLGTIEVVGGGWVGITQSHNHIISHNLECAKIVLDIFVYL